LAFELCDGMSASGVCLGPNGQTAYASTGSYTQFIFTFSETGGAGASCNVYYGTSDLSHNMPPTLTAAHGVKITSTALTAAAPGQAWEAPYTLMFAVCTVGAGVHSVLIEAAR
jgi:hypothetical protein